MMAYIMDLELAQPTAVPTRDDNIMVILNYASNPERFYRGLRLSPEEAEELVLQLQECLRKFGWHPEPPDYPIPGTHSS